MSIKNRVVSVLAAAGILAGSFGPLASVASADGWGDRSHPGYSSGHRDWSMRRDNRFRGFEQYRRPHHDARDWRAERRREERQERRDVARGVAIGLGVLMLGAILSQSAHHSDRYDN